MKNIRNIYIRNLLTIAVILLVSFAILGMVFATLSYRFVMNEKRNSMSVTSEEVTRIVSAYMNDWDVSSLEVRVALASISNISGFHIVACNSVGTVISCSDRVINCGHLGMQVPDALRGEIDAVGEYSGITSMGGLYPENRYVIGTSVRSNVTGNTICYLFLSGQTASMVEMWREFAGMFFITAVCVVSIAFIISLITTKKQARPINEMALAAHRFARGDFAVRVSETGRRDEIGELADAFNIMADSLERSEKQRSEFIANVSHELKTPMTTIAGFADGILDGTIPRERENAYLEIISSETRRLSRLVRSMLEMSRFQAMDAETALRQSFDISETIRVAILSLESKITERGLDVAAQLPEEPIVTMGDRDSILQVIYNLIDNAAKFAEKSSAIGIELWKENGRAFVAVENHGATIPQEQLPMIFDRFHKTDKSRSMDRDGVGLGLYIVKTILDRHNQDIFVTSEAGVTRFVFTLQLRIEK